jgi:two-component system, NtrC family, sensor kinase
MMRLHMRQTHGMNIAYDNLGLSSRASGFKMNTFPMPFKIVAATLMTIIVVTIGILNLRDRASWKDPTDGVFWVESASGLRAAEVVPEGPGARVGIKPGDLLISLEGRPIANLGEYSDGLYRIGPDGSALYGLKSESGNRDLAIRLSAKALLESKDGLRMLLAFLHLGIGLFVLVRGGSLSRAFHFYLICLAAFVLYLFSYTPKWGGLDQCVYAMSIAAILLLPAMFMHFCLRFPVDPKPEHTRAPLLYAPLAVLGFGHLLWITGHLARAGFARDARTAFLIDRVQLAYFCAGMLAGGILLLRRKLASRDLATRQQMKWVSSGTLAGVVPFSLIYGVPVLFGVRAGFAMLAAQLFLALIPLSFAYAILRFRLLDVEAIVRRSAAYLAASSLLLALYLIFVLVLGRWIESIIPEADFMIICIAVLVIAMMFAPLRNTIQARLDRIFYKEQFDDRASLLDFARTLSAEISLPRLSRRILERMAKTFQIEKVALFLVDPSQPGRFLLADALGSFGPVAEKWGFEESELGAEILPEDVHPPEGASRLRRSPAVLAGWGVHYLQDLRLGGRRIGLLGLGQLPLDRHFSSEDLDLLDALSGYAGIALENAKLYRSVENKALELERLRIYTENIIESINIAILALDLNGMSTSCNRAFEELYGLSRDRIVGSNAEELLGKEVIASIRKATGIADWNLRSTGNIFKLYLQSRKGEKLIVNISLIPLLDTGGTNSGCLIVMDNITEKVQLEEQLLQAEKMSSIGLLAAGIAHEVNTPITGISSYAQILLKDTPADDARKPMLEKIEKQTFRAAEIVNGLLNFARLNGSEFTDLDLNRLIRESLSLMEHQLQQNHVEVVYAPDQSIPMVYGNAGKLQQVFVNLFLNARDSMPSGGTLKVATSKNDTMVVVDIQDSGIGISPENIRKIYDPFFTTKSTGKGTGLGLAVTYGIIQDHGGRIFVDSIPSQGTHFTLKLPTRHSLHA